MTIVAAPRTLAEVTDRRVGSSLLGLVWLLVWPRRHPGALRRDAPYFDRLPVPRVRRGSWLGDPYRSSGTAHECVAQARFASCRDPARGSPRRQRVLHRPDGGEARRALLRSSAVESASPPWRDLPGNGQAPVSRSSRQIGASNRASHLVRSGSTGSSFSSFAFSSSSCALSRSCFSPVGTNGHHVPVLKP